ncbi:hypothetical protein PHYBOEH_008873 [Phytophthora boehmeriae]|uniref:Uncharacterized protein n=1 Tax=Phytophthora boehmeriae TaxID=109152 RepID=A0A8T1VXE8_9STRA|nr:hypothetical protein PHYBOEH_008873 [Phytophthora boehmeriae]
MDAAASAAFCASQREFRHAKNGVGSARHSSIYRENPGAELSLEDSEIDSSDDNFGEDALPRDRDSIEQELARLQELEAATQQETAPDLLVGYEMLENTQKAGVERAHALLERRKSAALKVFKYQEEKARETYRDRCSALKTEMNADIERELRRLQSAKDGVSVTSRRRRAVRDDTRAGFSTPGGQSTSNGMRRRRANDGEENAPEDVFLASASPEERAHRVQFQEKKRLERLLGSESIFKPVVRQVAAEEIAEDLEAIRSAAPCAVDCSDGQGVESRKRHKEKLPQEKQQGKEKKVKRKKKKESTRRRRIVVTPRRIPHMPQTNEGRVGSAIRSHSAASVSSKNRRPRLHYNPRMLQEGQEVEVYRRKRRKGATSGDEEEPEEDDECVLSGIITAATETHIYLLTAAGRFEAFDVRECVLGLIYVQEVENSKSLTENT